MARGRGDIEGVDDVLAHLRRELGRRLTWLGVGGVVIALGVQLDAAAWGWPAWTPSAVWSAGLAVALVGALGLARGLGCLTQIVGALWIVGLACGARTLHTPGTGLLGAITVGAGILALALRRRQVTAPRPGGIGPPGWGGPPSGGGGAEGPVVIDVEGHEGGRLGRDGP